MGRRSARAQEKSVQRPRRHATQARGPWPVSIFGSAAAALFVAAWIAFYRTHATTFAASLVWYWIGGGVVIATVSILLAQAPSAFVQSIPSRCVALLMRPSPRAMGAALFVVSAGLSVVFALYVFSRAPTTADEIAQLWHAKMLVHGHFSLPLDPNQEFFAIDNVIQQGRWYSEYPIGGPLVLAVGLLIGAPWLINPLLAGVTAIAMYQFARRAYGETEGRVVAALFALCPMATLMAGSYMNHVPVLCLATIALAALAAWESASGRRALVLAVIIGLALGAMATIRPLDATVCAIAIGVFQLATIRSSDGTRARELGVQIAAAAFAVAPLLWANAATTGSPFRFGYNVLWGAAHQLGFHPDPAGTVHTVGRGVAYASAYVSELNIFAAMWPVPALLFAVVGLVAMPRVSRWDVLLLGFFWMQVVAYGAYWHDGQFIGPRFLFTVLPAVVVLLARAPFHVRARAGAVWGRTAAFATLICVLAAWTIPAPYSVPDVAQRLRADRPTMKADLAGDLAQAGVHNALVFVREPFGVRLQHRLWNVGMPLTDAAHLFMTSEACSLLVAVRVAEADTLRPVVDRLTTLVQSVVPYDGGRKAIGTSDAAAHISPTAVMPAACRAELEGDTTYPVAFFGSALPLEPIDRDGHIDGDVIYVADMGERNERLRARFGRRTWYRLRVAPADDGGMRATATPY